MAENDATKKKRKAVAEDARLLRAGRDPADAKAKPKKVKPKKGS